MIKLQRWRFMIRNGMWRAKIHRRGRPLLGRQDHAPNDPGPPPTVRAAVTARGPFAGRSRLGNARRADRAPASGTRHGGRRDHRQRPSRPAHHRTDPTVCAPAVRLGARPAGPTNRWTGTTAAPAAAGRGGVRRGHRRRGRNRHRGAARVRALRAPDRGRRRPAVAHDIGSAHCAGHHDTDTTRAPDPRAHRDIGGAPDPDIHPDTRHGPPVAGRHRRRPCRPGRDMGRHDIGAGDIPRGRPSGRGDAPPCRGGGRAAPPPDMDATSRGARADQGWSVGRLPPTLRRRHLAAGLRGDGASAAAGCLVTRSRHDPTSRAADDVRDHHRRLTRALDDIAAQGPDIHRDMARADAARHARHLADAARALAVALGRDTH